MTCRILQSFQKILLEILLVFALVLCGCRSTTDPTWRFSYDKNGGINSATTPGGKVMTLDRDALVRFTTIERNPDRSASQHIELGWKDNELKILGQRWAQDVNLAFFKVNVYVGFVVLGIVLVARAAGGGFFEHSPVGRF